MIIAVVNQKGIEMARSDKSSPQAVRRAARRAAVDALAKDPKIRTSSNRLDGQPVNRAARFAVKPPKYER